MVNSDLCEMTDLLQEIKIEKLLNKNQKVIFNTLKEHGGLATQKDLLAELDIEEPTLIQNIKKLEEAGIVISDRSAVKFLFLNPVVSDLPKYCHLVKGEALKMSKIFEAYQEMKLKKKVHRRSTAQRTEIEVKA
jgi:DNA-binding Lrp family transcriptional regulator